VREGWQLLKIRGIPLRIHPSWFLILALATLAFHQDYSIQLAGDGLQAIATPVLWALALVTAVLLFLSVVLH
jgi:hypothetical protein